jgi:hypothetical protein
LPNPIATTDPIAVADKEKLGGSVNAKSNPVKAALPSNQVTFFFLID